MLFDATDREVRRDFVVQHIKDKGYKRVIDFGGALGPWAREVVTHYFDIHSVESMKEHIDPATYPNVPEENYIVGDMSNPFTWEPLLMDVIKNGMFDFAICTQTLEHVFHPELAIKLIVETSERGFLGFPSKYTELRRSIAFGNEGFNRCPVYSRPFTEGSPWRGFFPHRWIVTLRDDKIWFWPKVNAIEYLFLDWADEVTDEKELSVWWEKDIPFHIVTDDYLDHPDPQKACELYCRELKEGL